MSESETTQHKVELDYVGFKATPRLTCYTCGKTLVVQGWVKDETIAQFKQDHPCDAIKDGGYRG